ncbi:glycoside hydrolase domain-containing protein [Janthinobacterium sp. MDB2-8]|uniref:glycoside hydrolase domain-containing protein n=1 Tax=Janthinobacterium sp. MDB2-8 TaxID=1259338 RepID=UPI003F25C3BE
MSDQAGLDPVNPTITRLPPADVGLDYRALVDEGTRLVQQLSGDIWTNFNYSDPGVTILEQLCYALTELSYRASFPVPDLLGAPVSGMIVLERQGLHAASAIMPVNPVTAADLRRVLLDRVPEVANVWLTPLPAEDSGGVAGLYRLDVLPRRSDCSCDSPAEAALPARLLDIYAARRALCEDVAACVLLAPLATRLQASVLLDEFSDPDAVLAQLLFAVGMVLAPEPRRTSLATLRQAGRSSAEIFQGPLLLQGFVDSEQLTPLPRFVPVEAVLAAMAGVAGVLAVDALLVFVQGHAQGYGVEQIIDAGAGNILQLDTAWHDDGLVLVCGDAVCVPNPAKVRRLLNRAWAQQRRRYPLADEYDTFYPPPAGKGQPLSLYSSVQEQFPAVYGISTYGLPSGAGTARYAQAMQLKGYLMAFDQLMADYFSQLAFVRELFSVTAGGERTYAWQSLRGSVPDAAALLNDDYERGMARLTAQNDPVIARQTAVLGYLLSLYASPLTAPAPVSGKPGTTLVQQAALVRARQALLLRIVAATHDRGRGLDYRQSSRQHPLAGLEIRCRIELGLLETAHGSGTDTGADTPFGQLLPDDDSARIEAGFLPVDDGSDDELPDDGAAQSPLVGREVAPALLAALADPLRYRLGALYPGAPLILVCQDMDGRWWQLAPCRDAVHAVTLTAALLRAADGGHEALFIVEWVLLRDALPGLAHADGQAAAEFNFRISAVMPARRGRDDDGDEAAGNDGWRNQVRAILRDNTPAHIVFDELVLGHRRMRRFLRLYREWRHVLRHGSPGRRGEVCRRMAHFLQEARRPDAPALQRPPATVPDAGAGPRAAPELATAAESGKPWRRLLRTGSAAPPASAAVPEHLAGAVAPAWPGASGVYVDGKLDSATAQAFAGQGYAFVLRKLSWSDAAPADGFNSLEANEILQAGLALMPVQTMPPEASLPAGTAGAELGARDGKRAAALARWIGFPAGVSVWLQLGPHGTGATPQTMLDYCNAWHDAVAHAGYVPGLGLADGGLPGDETYYAQLRFQQYWGGGACLRGGPRSGACLMPAIDGAGELAGVVYRWQFIEADRNGNTPLWLAPPA